MTRPSLQRRITWGLFVYAALLTLSLFISGLMVNEAAERMVWQSLLDNEMQHIEQRMAADQRFHWDATDALALYADPPDILAEAPPAAWRNFAPGLHDDIVLNDTLWVVLVREHPEHRLYLALDIDAFEQHEWHLLAPQLAGSAGVTILLCTALAWGVRRLVRPLATLAGDIAQLQPDHPGKRLSLPPEATSELAVIANAVNAYLDRNAQFMRRERQFIETASHELRTPIAVLSGAAQLALEQTLPAMARRQIERIARTGESMEHLVTLLLAMSRDPSRLARASERFSLYGLLEEAAEDHQSLCRDKDLLLKLDATADSIQQAPADIVRAAIGNLLRNAIENSERGTIHVHLAAPAIVTIEDPGHGMTAEEIARLHARLARSESESGDGIGLALIARLCEHFGWQLQIDSMPGHGTRATLDLSSTTLD